MLPKLLRIITLPLVAFRPTYFIGMVLVRFARKMKANNTQATKDFRTIPNFMGNIKMRVDKNSYMGGSIYWTGFHHISELLFLGKFLKSDMTFVDVGANQGEFSLFAASKLNDGKVIAFEPINFQLGLLRDNVALNNYEHVTIHDYGLLDKPGEMEAYTSEDLQVHSGVNEGLSSLYKSDNRSEFEQMIALKVFDDEYFDQLDRLDVVKIDIEGAELYALKGMSKSIEKFHPLIIIEMNEVTFREAGYSMQDVLDFMTGYDYKPYRIFRGRLQEINGQDELSAFSNIAFK